MEKTIGIYIHIPFCVKKCAYCDFLSATPHSAWQIEAYVEVLCKEIELRGVKMPCVDTIFFGGGTPSLLPVELFSKVMVALRENFVITPDAEITVECNPETVDEEKLLTYKALGVNRISFGLQSASDKELKLIGRIHTFGKFLENYGLARKAGFDNINVDLISALPEQKPEDWEETLETVAKLQPSHISAYSLILEEGTKLYEEKDAFTFPTEDEDVRMYEATARILGRYGYERYEISNYAKKGAQSCHNNRYWKRGEYLGFGIGAASFVDNKRFNNISDIDEYIDCLKCLELDAADGSEEKNKALLERITVDEMTLSVADAMAEFFYLGLRRMEGVYFKDFRDMFGSDVMSHTCYVETIEKLVGQGLLEYIENGSERLGVRLTTEGIFVSNMVFVEFI